MTTAVSLVGWTLIHFAWQGTAIALAAALLLWTLRGAAAPWRYATSCGALLLMLAAPVLTAQSLRATSAASPAGVATRDEVRIVVLRHGGTLAGEAPPAEPTPPAAAPGEPALRLVVLCWLSGVLLLGVRLAGGLRRAWRLQQTARAAAASPWQDTARVLAARLGITRAITVVDSTIVNTPAMLGWLSPLIVLPVAALAGLSPAQVEAILAHELAHVRRHDYLVNLLQVLAETLLFYHPAVWWVSRRIRIEREHCCDDMAVAISGDPVAYAAALAELEAFRSAQGTFALAATGGSLLDRVRRVLAPKRQEPRTANGLAVASIAALVLIGGGSMVQQLGASAADGARARQLQQVERIRLQWGRTSSDNVDLLTTPELALRGATIARQAQDAYLEVATDLRHDLAARPTLALVESDTAMRRLLDARLLPSTVGPLIMVPVDRSDEETAALLRHELTHAFVTSILGPLDVPLWITEGVAAHQSGVWGALERSRLLRLLGGRALPTLASLNAGTGDREVASTVGHAAFDFIDARWGKQGIRDLLLALRTAGGDVGASTDAAFGMPLADFDRAFADYAGAILSPPPPPAPPPAAATVRQADPAAGAEPRFDFTASRITVRDASLSDLIRFAYGLRPDQLVGGPAWLDSERFDVTTDGDGDGMHYGSAALRAVLEDRFALRLREGTIDVPVYELRAAGPLGPSLSRSPAACHGLDLEQPYQGGCGLRWQGIGRAEGHGITMAQLAATISHAGPFDRPVVDRTGLSDAYDFELRFTPYARRAESPVNRVAQALEWASITDPLPVALREQLGLSLVEGTGTAPVFIVDHVAHPERD